MKYVFRGVIFYFLFLGLWTQAAMSSVGRDSKTGVSERVRLNLQPQWEVSLGGGFGTFQGNLGWGIGVGMLRPISTPTPAWMGLELGFSKWDFGLKRDIFGLLPGQISQSDATVLHVLPTFMFHQYFPGVYQFYSFFGVSMGPAIYFAEGREALNTGESSVRERIIYPMIFARPGIGFNLTSDFGVRMEARIGYLATKLLFHPQTTVAWIL